LSYLANCSMLFTEVPLLERPAAAKSAGFDAVEFWWPFTTATPDDGEVERFVRAVADAGTTLVGLNFAAGDMPAGDRGLVSWPGREQEFRDSVDIAVGIADRLGTRAFNALYGNRVEGTPAQQQDEVAVANLAVAVAAAAQIDATVLLEPVSGAPRYPLLRAADVVSVLDRIRQETGADNLRMLADLYHLSVNGDDLSAVVAAHHEHIGHVQIADSPGRHEPGTGTLDLDRWLQQLQATGYDGWVGLEYAPSTTTIAGLEWLPTTRRAAAARAG